MPQEPLAKNSQNYYLNVSGKEEKLSEKEKRREKLVKNLARLRYNSFKFFQRIVKNNTKRRKLRNQYSFLQTLTSTNAPSPSLLMENSFSKNQKKKENKEK